MEVGVVVLEGAEVTVVPAGEVPLAVAVLAHRPASTSACVIVYVAVQTVRAPGASVVVGQATPGSDGSATATPVRVTAAGVGDREAVADRCRPRRRGRCR